MVSHAIFYDILFPPYIVDNIEPDGRIYRPDGHQIHVDALYTYIADIGGRWGAPKPPEGGGIGHIIVA